MEKGVNRACLESAEKAGAALRDLLQIPKGSSPAVAIIPGSGWGDAFEDKDFKVKIRLQDVPGLEEVANLDGVDGHGKWLGYMEVKGLDVVICSRIHGYQDPSMKLARLSIEMLFHAGVRYLISTSGCGSLSEDLVVGDIAVPRAFLGASFYSPPMAFAGDDFAAPEDGVDHELSRVAIEELGGKLATHMICRGPHLEGRWAEKPLFKSWGAEVIGMSGQWEMYLARLYRDLGVRALMLCLITNDDKEEHDHEEISRRGADRAEQLRKFLEAMMAYLD